MVHVRIWRLSITLYDLGACGLMLAWGRRGYGHPQVVLGHVPLGRRR